MHAPFRTFWQLFATTTSEVAGGVGLSSRPTPLNFANGVWGPDPARLDEAVAWCEAQQLPPAAIVALDHPLLETRAAERLLVASGVALEAESGGDTGTVVEQIGWTHTRPLAELFAYRYDRMDIEEELVRSVAAAMQRDRALEAYLAFDAAGEPAGAALAFTFDSDAGRPGRGGRAADHPAGNGPPAYEVPPNGLVLIWAEGLKGHDPTLAVASRFGERTPWRITTSDPGSSPADDALVTVARVALAP